MLVGRQPCAIKSKTWQHGSKLLRKWVKLLFTLITFSRTGNMHYQQEQVLISFSSYSFYSSFRIVILSIKQSPRSTLTWVTTCFCTSIHSLCFASRIYYIAILCTFCWFLITNWMSVASEIRLIRHLSQLVCRF